MSEIINRVANSPIISLDLEDYYVEGPRIPFDLHPYLFQGMIVRERDFRQALKEMDWECYRNALVYVYCSVNLLWYTSGPCLKRC
jgi:hypothetical protein